MCSRQIYGFSFDNFSLLTCQFLHTYSAPFEVVPYTEEPFSHHWWTPHPPRINRSLFNVPPACGILNYISMWRWWWWWRQIKTNMKNFNKNKYANFHEKYLWRCSAAFDDDDDDCDDDDDDNKDHLRKIR